jgi:hypothetical protein
MRSFVRLGSFGNIDPENLKSVIEGGKLGVLFLIFPV